MARKHHKQTLPPKEGGEANGLTSIHRRIHCGATPDTTDFEDELDQITIDHFLDTLAEVATAIARRRQRLDL